MNNLNEMRKWFENINSRIWATIEMTPEVYEILGTLYNEEEVLVKDIEVLSNTEYKVRCVFPEYKKTKIASDHVSVSQMGDAIMHGAFMALWLYVKNNPDKVPFDFEKFLQIRMHAKYLGDERRFIKEIKSGEDAYIVFDVESIVKKQNFYIATMKLKWTKETFVRGQVECLLEDKYM